MTHRLIVGDADPGLDERLSSELDTVNARAVPGAGARELTVQCREGEDLLEIFRWDGVPVEGEADTHVRKEL